MVTFQRRVEFDDGFGGTRGEWQDQFTVPARLKARLGTESVIAARLQGTQPYTMVIRSSQQSRAITPAWRVYDARAGIGSEGVPSRLFDIKAVSNVDERNKYLDLLVVENGV